jgi:hypothetical protein
MRPERQIKERIEIYEAQIEDYKSRLAIADAWSNREYYRHLITENLRSIDLLEWVVDKTFYEIEQDEFSETELSNEELEEEVE